MDDERGRTATWCTTGRSQHRLPAAGPTIGSCTVVPSSTVRDLGVYIDSDLSMKSHVQQTVSRCFSALRRLRSIRRQVPTAVFQSLVVALVVSWLDYCNSVLAGLPAILIQRLQWAQNAAARLIYRICRYDHITDALLSASTRTNQFQNRHPDLPLSQRQCTKLPLVLFHSRC